MTLISSTIPNFVNGVSQQPYTLRLSSQGSAQENGLSSVATGLRKRPPTEHVARIMETPPGDAFMHTIDRDGDERYHVIVTGGALRVFTLGGVERVVNAPDGLGYLATGVSPVASSFAMTTVADYTFVVNKTVPVAASATLRATRPYEALLNIKLGNYGKTYEILINGTVVASYETPDGTSAADSVTLSTENIASELLVDLLGGGFNTAPWSVTRHGAVIYLKNTATDFTVATQDGFNSTAMVAVKGNLQKFTDLPPNPRVHGFVVQITGEQSSGFDNYWVTFDGGGTNDSVGVWRETAQPGIPVGFSAATMPHQLVREADGTFTFRQGSWEERKVGDPTSNPNPSMVGRTVNDVFFYQNRLGFLSDESYIQSETGKYFNLYRTTVTTLLDSDPVDVSAATNKVAVLQHAVGFNKQLLIFSAQQQFMVDSDEPTTAARVPIKPTTDFPVNVVAKPVTVGRNVYFTTDKGLWSSVREYFVDPNSQSTDAGDVSAHVPKYIPSGVVKIASSSSEGVLALLSSRDRNKLYIYCFYFSGAEKLQSSWSRFSMPSGSTIRDISFFQSVLYLLVERTDGLYIERMDYSSGAEVTGEPYQVTVDRKVVIPSSALVFNGTHTLVAQAAIGYSPSGDGLFAVAHGGGNVKAGQMVTGTFAAGVLTLPGNLTGTDISFGVKYTFRYVLSPLTVKTPSPGGGTISDTEGRLQVHRVGFNHSDTGYFAVKVTPEGRPTYTYVFSGKVLGTPTAEIGTQTFAPGRFNAAVRSRNTTVDIAVESDLPLPVSLLSADWEGQYVKRSRSV